MVPVTQQGLRDYHSYHKIRPRVADCWKDLMTQHQQSRNLLHGLVDFDYLKMIAEKAIFKGGGGVPRVHGYNYCMNRLISSVLCL